MSLSQFESGTPHLQLEDKGDGVWLARLNRPEARNAVSFEMWQGFSRLLDALECDTPVRALILAGANQTFSTGGDMKIPPARGEGALSPATRLEWGQRIISRLRKLPVPVIAAVEGGVYGIGWAIALACDMLVVADNAKFGAPFVQVGLAPDGGVAWMISQIVGRYRAAEILLSARTLEAQEVYALGLASRLVASGTAEAEAIALGQSLGLGNRHAVELTKRLIHDADGSTLESSHALELAYCAILQKGEELERARAAFIARSQSAKNKG